LRKAWRHVRHREFVAAEAALSQAVDVEQPQWPGWLLSDRWNTTWYLQVEAGTFDAARASFEKAAMLLPLQGEGLRRYRMIVNTAAQCSLQQQWDQVVAVLEPVTDLALQDRRLHGMIDWACGLLVLALTQLGRLDDASRRLQQALPRWRASAVTHFWAYVPIRLAVAQGRIADALRLVGADDASRDRYGYLDRLLTSLRTETQDLIEAAAPDPGQRQRWRSEGESLDDAAVEALALGDSPNAPST
jgi:tetratricopeptide (TPR) repeat protein